MNIPPRIILSRPDALGDAVVTMTTAGWIKQQAPDTHVTVLVKRYTLDAWRQCAHADAILVLEDLQALGEEGAARALKATGASAIVHAFPHQQVARWAKQAGIACRIGTSHRWWHWTTCNERVSFSRKRSELHEAQLNIKLLRPFGMDVPATISELVPHIGYKVPAPSAQVRSLLRDDRRNVILHPLLGSGLGWGFANFTALIAALDPARYHVLITGTAAEAERYRPSIPRDAGHVTDVGGELTLHQLMELIGACDAFVSASTGPLHVAAASGIRAIGLFSMRRPIFPARWAPIGRDAHALTFDPRCVRCARGEACDCIQRISPARVVSLLDMPGV
jgi:ADP-heptose:LPS heptosyltransferase